MFFTLWCISVTPLFGVERHYGTVRKNLEVICINHCGDYNLDPDIGDIGVYLTGQDIGNWLGLHVRVTGFRNPCGGCTSIFVTSIVLDPLVAVGEYPPQVPSAPRLEQNYPNPFNPMTSIHYVISERQHISLKVYSVLGEQVANLTEGVVSPGEYTIAWDATHFPSGVYYYKLETTKFTSLRKMLLIK